MTEIYFIDMLVFLSTVDNFPVKIRLFQELAPVFLINAFYNSMTKQISLNRKKYDSNDMNLSRAYISVQGMIDN